MKPDQAAIRIPSLDGLRALLILMVLFGHLCGTANFPITTGDPLNIGSLGVRFFFVISGFLIMGILLNEFEKNKTIDLLKFYYRRTLRIFPAYYFFLAVLGICALLNLFRLELWEWLTGIFYISNFVQTKEWEIGHAWSLAVEEQFYLVMPGLLFLAGKRKTFLILLAAVVLAPFVRLSTYSALGDDLRWVGFGFQANADSLATGCLLAFLRAQLHRQPFYRKLLNFKLFAMIPAAAFSLNLLYERPKIYYFAAISIINVCVGLTIDWGVTNYNKPFGKVLNAAPLVYIGTLSYSIYLWQQLFLNKDGGSILTAFPQNLLFAGICALISFYMVEKPALSLRSRLEPAILAKKKSLNESAISA